MPDSGHDPTVLPLSPSPPAPSSSPATPHFFPWATSPDIIRSHEKDAYITATLTSQAQSILRSLRGARFTHAHGDTIKNLTELLYLSLTTLVGNRTLGEEYCDVVQIEDGSLKLPSLVRRAGYVASSVGVPWVLGWLLPRFRARLRAKLERNVARLQMKAVMAKGMGDDKKPSVALRVQSYVLEHLDSLTSLSPIFAVNLMAFYFSGAYYHISKRIWGLRYVFTKKIGDNEERVGYEVLGVLLVLQIVVQAIVHAKHVLASLQQTDQAQEEKRDDKSTLSSIHTPASIPSLPPDTSRYDLEAPTRQNSSALTWIPAGQQRKCTLCLEAFKDPSVNTCGHVFCWTCIRDWVREKPECPLCRQEALGSKILPLRG